MVRKMIYRSAAMLMALGLFASACSSDGGSGDTDDGGGEPAPSRSTLEIAKQHQLSDMNPFTPQGLLTDIAYMRILGVNNENEIFSQVLESWETSEDARTVTLNVQPGIEWNDGTPITAADIVMTLTQHLDPELSVNAGRISGVVGTDAFVNGDADTISGITAPDDHTVVIDLDSPDAAWLANIATIGRLLPLLPHHILGDVPHDELQDHEFFTTHPVTSGPYQFVDYIPEQHMEFERNPNWSLGEAGFERLFIKYTTPDVMGAQLETGEVQIMSVNDPTEADRISNLEGIEVQYTTGAAPDMFLPMHFEPLDDPRVRQAMLYAIDREGICQEVLKGYCSVPLTNVRQIAPEWSIPTEDMIEYPYDPDRARELLDEAGWDSSTELTLFSVSEGNEPESVLAIAQDNLADVGMNWSIEKVDISAYLEAIETAPENAQAIFGGGANFTVDPSAVQVYSECDNAYPAGLNTTHYCDPELDELWAAGRQTADQDERAQIYHEAFRMLNRNPDELHLYVPDRIAAHDARLKGVKPHPDGNYEWNVGEWTWEE